MARLRMARMRLAAAFAALSALMLSGCTTIQAFNTLTPKDPAAVVARNVAFGTHPRQRLDVYSPTPAVKDAPVVVFFYGGSWSSGRRQDYAWVARALASRGFLTVAPDYRLYPEVRYPLFLEDGAKAVRWAQDHAAEYGGDPSRILLAGHSAGAYNAVQLALDTSYLRAQGVEPSRIKGVVGLAGPYDFLPLDVDETRTVFGQAQDLKATQPLHHVRRDAPPILLAHGTADTEVGLYHTQNLAKALEAAGAPVEMRIYPGVNHTRILLALSQPFRGSGVVLSDITRFLQDAAAR